MSIYCEYKCPECGYIWKGWVPDCRVECFLERCHNCGKVVIWTFITKEGGK
jgi:hypothetical protein